MKTAFKVFYYIVLGLLGLIAVLLLISAFPIAGNFQVKIIQSGSMQPTIKTGSVSVIKPAQDYKIGDIITFQSIGEIESVTHRVVDIKTENGQTKYTTKGDANNAPDLKEVPKNRVIGRVLFSIPYLGYVVSFAQKPIGFLLIIIVPALVIVYDEIRKIWKEILRIKKKNEEQDKEIKEHVDKEN
jgi:signal peptidase I